jgi:hypothetical protein
MSTKPHDFPADGYHVMRVEGKWASMMFHMSRTSEISFVSGDESMTSAITTIFQASGQRSAGSYNQSLSEFPASLASVIHQLEQSRDLFSFL